MAGDNHNQNHNAELSKAEQQKEEHHHAASPPRETASSAGRGLFGTVAAAYHAVMKDGSIAGLLREGLKDIQDTFHQVAWGQSPHGREPGAPLTPLHRDIAAGREQHAVRIDLPSPGDIAKGRNFTAAEREESNVQTAHADIEHGREQHTAGRDHASPGDVAKGRNFTAAERENGNVQGRGEIETAQNEKPIVGPWTERILEERERTENGDGQNEVGRGRSLPDEQRENDNSQGR
jgi:hypothetical protein